MLGGRRTRWTRHTRQLGLHDGQALDGIDRDHPTGEEWKSIPRAIKLWPVTAGVNVEVADFTQICRRQVFDLEDPKPPLVVGLIHQIPNDVLVVIDCGNGRQVTADENWAGGVEHVPDIGLRVVPEILLIEFIVHQEIPMIRGERALMGIARSGIRRARDLNGRCLIGDIHDGHCVLVGRKAEFLPT